MARSFVAASTQYLEVSAAALTTGPNTNGVTLACWFKIGTAQATGNLMGLHSSTTFERFELQTRGVAAIVRAIVADSATSVITDTTATWTAGTWRHAAAVFATTTSRSVYLDGGNVVNSVISQGSPSGLNVTTIGRRGGVTPSSYMDGVIAEAGIWNAALTAKEVAALGQGVSPLYVRPGNLVGYWPLWGVHSPEIDLVGTPHLMTVTGATLANHPPVIPYNVHRWGTGGSALVTVTAKAPPPFHRTFHRFVGR